MSVDDAPKTVIELLKGTAPRELDCDEFVDALAPLLDERLAEDQVALVEHHREICPECDEQLLILKRALKVDA